MRCPTHCIRGVHIVRSDSMTSKGQLLPAQDVSQPGRIPHLSDGNCWAIREMLEPDATVVRFMCLTFIQPGSSETELEWMVTRC